MSADGQKFCLKWNDYRHSVSAAFEGLRQDEELVDMTLCCEGRKIKAHRMMLSACSPFFRELLKENPCQHPVFLLRDVSYQDLWSAIEFVYKGEVNVSQANLASFLKTAEMLQLRGLTDDDNKSTSGMPESQPPASAASSPRPASSQSRRRTDSSPGWEAEPAASAPRPAKRPRTQDTTAPPPPPPPPPSVAAAAALGPVTVKREMPPPPLFEPGVSYSAEQEPDAGLRSILYHDLTRLGQHGGVTTELDGSAAAGGDPSSMQLLEPDAAAEAFAGADDNIQNVYLYPCETCGKTYRHRNSLAKHMKVHLEVSAGAEDSIQLVFAGADDSIQQGFLYSCQTCGNSYRRYSSLAKHMKMHLGETKCQKCGAVFSSKWMLSYHSKHSRCARAGAASSE